MSRDDRKPRGDRKSHSHRRPRTDRKPQQSGFVVYGAHPVQQALEQLPRAALAGAVLTLSVGRGQGAPEVEALAERQHVRTKRTDRETLDELVEGENHQGMVLRLTSFPFTDLHDIMKRPGTRRRILVLDQIQDPRNLGAMVRSAAAFGVQGVVITKDRSATVTSTAVKTSAGAALRLPIAQVTNLARALGELRDAGFWIYGAAGDDGASTPSQVDWDRDVAFVMGSEGKGLRRLTRDHCDALVRIPQTELVESLNVAVAAGILLYAAQV